MKYLYENKQSYTVNRAMVEPMNVLSYILGLNQLNKRQNYEVGEGKSALTSPSYSFAFVTTELNVSACSAKQRL